LWFDDPDDALPGTLGIAVEWLDLERRRAEAEGIARPDAEWVLEATWALPLGERWVVQPDLQYVRQPGGSRDADAAWVVGVRLAWETGF
jgi:porin